MHTVPPRDKSLKYINQIVKKSAVNIEFQDVKYFVRDVNSAKGWRQLLHSVSGKFCCGEMTAILGPSGAGKSTLLNILAGYTKESVQGTIKINNDSANVDVCKKLSSYIMQDNIVQPRLTVIEAITYAAKFKLGRKVTNEVIEEVIEFLGLKNCRNTRSEYLSGGERKRLTVALELIGNPPVMFLDEPTTGLDDFAVVQCIDLLKKISQLGRTVVCTIHQPSPRLFELFDQVYVLAEGFCVYNGTPSELVSFLSTTGYPCPSNYTPSDYVIELVNLYPLTITNLQSAIQNGKINKKEISTQNGDVEIWKKDVVLGSTFSEQFFLLLSRSFKQIVRNNVALITQFIHHFFCGVMVGLIFEGIGNDASRIISLIKFCICCNVFFSYTYVMGPIVSCKYLCKSKFEYYLLSKVVDPFEVELLKREIFNRWYDLKAYYIAYIIITLPLLLVLSTIFTVIVYFLTDQPKEMHRFVGFYLICLMMALTSQGMGYLIGSVLNVTKGAVVGPTVIASLLLLATYGMDYQYPVNPLFRLGMDVDFLRNGIVGLCSVLFRQREPLSCKAFYCYFTNPEQLAKKIAIPMYHYKYHLLHCFVFLVLYRVLIFVALKCRLNYELSSKLVYYGKRLLKIVQLVK